MRYNARCLLSFGNTSADKAQLLPENKEFCLQFVTIVKSISWYHCYMKLENNAKIKEIFSSIQGEGPYIGCKQIFIRFCACNLNCFYCDTDFYPSNINDKNTFFEFTPIKLLKYLENNFDLESTHSISLTGGEPLIWADFLKEFMPMFNQKYDIKFYLETNGTISDNAKIILPFTDILASDIKLPSCSGVNNSFELHEMFYNSVSQSVNKSYNNFSYLNNNSFAKVVFDSNITSDEIDKTVELAMKYHFEIILQPRMIDDKLSVGTEFMMKIFETFVKKYKYTRLIPQVHKFINVE